MSSYSKSGISLLSFMVFVPALWADDVTYITTCAQFQDVTGAGEYRIQQDISCQEESFSPNNLFIGKLIGEEISDGVWPTISGISIEEDRENGKHCENSGTGIFRQLGSANGQAEVKNLNIHINTVNNTASQGLCVGGLAGTSYHASIENVNVTIEDKIIGQQFVGGLVGWNLHDLDIQDSHVSGHIEATRLAAGGLIGFSARINRRDGSPDKILTIQGASAMGQVKADNSAGGLLGAIGNVAQISDSYAISTVTAHTARAGGLVGFAFAGPNVIDPSRMKIAQSYSAGDVKSPLQAGGLMGVLDTATIITSYSFANVEGIGDKNNQIGGLVGLITDRGVVEASFALGSVSGEVKVGGLAGSNFGGTIKNSFATGRVDGVKQVGGLVGTNAHDEDGRIRHDALITNSYATGLVSATGLSAGGLVGENYAVIKNSHASGDVNGNEKVGGLVGAMFSDAFIISSKATGRVIATNSATAGGLTGIAKKVAGEAINSYWDITSTGQLKSGHGEGFDAQHMKEKETYSDWDFNEEWFFIDNTRMYPQLKFNAVEVISCEMLENMKISHRYLLAESINCNLENPLPPLSTSLIGIKSKVDGKFPVINLTLRENSNNDNMGLFSKIMPEGLAANFEIELLADVVGGKHVGALAGVNRGVVDNVHVKSSHDKKVKGILNVGGLVGNNAEITALITSSSASVAAEDKDVNNVYFDSPAVVGGLVGMHVGATIRDSEASGSVSGQSYLGGLVGAMFSDAFIISSKASGHVTGSSNYVGGLVGRSSNSTIKSSRATGSRISGYDDVGGLVGSSAMSNTVIDSVAENIHITGTKNVGGLIGHNSESNISYSRTVDASIVGNRNVGGLVGINSHHSTIEDSEAINMTIRGSSLSFSGGLVGDNNNAIIKRSRAISPLASANVAIEGMGTLGGLTGSTRWGGEVHDSYAIVTVKAILPRSSEVGGLAAQIVEGKVLRSYAAGELLIADGVPQRDFGGLIGISARNSLVEMSYWDKQGTGQERSDGGVGKETVQMRQQSTYQEWNFDDVWCMPSTPDNQNHGYPLLRSLSEDNDCR